MEEATRIIETLASFQVPIEGGFGGGDQKDTAHYAHLAPTFASLSAMACLGDQRGFELLHRPALKGFLKRLKQPDGSFRMHEVDGEIDARAAYCAVVAGKLTDCWDEELEEGVVEWLAGCQSFEGGFGGVWGAEAHGGYTYCALAAAMLISPTRTAAKFDLPRLVFWLSSQQCAGIGGFRGRTHKLADGCYSFWQGACFELLRQEFGNVQLFDAAGLQNFILQGCQSQSGLRGGLRDKPGK
jgi:protein farnesyltransferase subunit beta